MSRNKFGELVKKYIVDATSNAERRVLGHLPSDYVGMNVYEALNVMLNILYEKDGLDIEAASYKVSKIANIYYDQAKEIVRAHKRYKKLGHMEKKEVLVTKVKKKVRGHDKYRFFINKPGTEKEDIKRVLEEAEKEGYDLVAVNNTNSNNPPFIYGTTAVVRLIDTDNECIQVFNMAKPFETKCRKGWYIIDTKLTITELFEAIKEAEESKVKIVVERYRVTTKKAKG